MFNISAKSSFRVFSVWVYVPQNRVEILWLQQIARRDPRLNGAPHWSEYYTRIKHLSEKQMMHAQIYLVQNVLLVLSAELTNVDHFNINLNLHVFKSKYDKNSSGNGLALHSAHAIRTRQQLPQT